MATTNQSGGSDARNQAVQRSVEQRAKRAAQSIQFLNEGIHGIFSFLFSMAVVVPSIQMQQ